MQKIVIFMENESYKSLLKVKIIEKLEIIAITQVIEIIAITQVRDYCHYTGNYYAIIMVIPRQLI